MADGSAKTELRAKPSNNKRMLEVNQARGATRVIRTRHPVITNEATGDFGRFRRISRRT
jgi:hypothetical protein